jgi:hypothetical protein
MAERTPARSAGPAPASSARMLPANVAPCAAPARPLAASNDATRPSRRDARTTITAPRKMTIPAHWAVAGAVRPASGAPIALGAISEANTAAAISVFDVPS